MTLKVIARKFVDSFSVGFNIFESLTAPESYAERLRFDLPERPVRSSLSVLEQIGEDFAKVGDSIRWATSVVEQDDVLEEQKQPS